MIEAHRTSPQAAELAVRRTEAAHDHRVGHLHFDRQARVWRTPVELLGVRAATARRALAVAAAAGCEDL